MKHLLKKLCTALLLLAACGMIASCNMMEEDLSDCPQGLYITFKYDYNLERADMFNDHVGSVTLYIFDEDGNLVRTQEESNTPSAAPLKSRGYAMHVEGLAPGKYKFIALAGQRPYGEMMQDSRAKFVRTDMQPGSPMQALGVQLDRTLNAGGGYDIVNNSLPLDTLWHGIETAGFEVSATRPTYGTISLVRDTKKVNVTLREIEDPTEMDVAKYDMTITDRNSTILWDNSLDETATVVYRPHATWNTDDRTPAVDGTSGEVLPGVGKIAHADFMTSRILIHDDPAADGVLSVVNRETGAEVIRVNLPDLLSRLRTSEDIWRYTAQEFLDRGYDYQLDFFLSNGKLSYVNIGISVLGWSQRVQFEDL